MSENNENTLTSYLGHDFQQNLFWQILVEPEFAEKALNMLEITYFDDPILKKLFIICLEYRKEYDKVPNLQNNSIKQAINQFKTPNNPIEEQTLFAVLENINNYNQMIINKELLHDGDVIQAATLLFIKQQEYRKLGEFILHKTQRGEIKQKQVVGEIEDSFRRITEIGIDDDDCEEVVENVNSALTKEFRKTIPTGVQVIDAVTGGGLGKSEIGIILAPSGVGKTTLLTKIANTAHALDYNVAQIIFEDTKDQVKRKHYAIWTGIPLSEMDDKLDEARLKVNEKIRDYKEKGRGKLIIKRFTEEDTTMVDVKNWMLSYQKKHGIKFDLLTLDYLDCLESHKKTKDRNEAELVIVKSFERLATDLEIPCWSAIQSNRSGFDAELVEAHQSGGNIKRVQKAHFFMSVAKTPDQKEAHLANFRIIKARFAQDGQTFKDAIYNNDTMEIRIEDSKYKNNGLYSEHKKYRDEDFNEFNEKAGSLHAKVSNIEDAQIVEDNSLLGDVMCRMKKEKNIEKPIEKPIEEKIAVPVENNDSSLAGMYGLVKNEPEPVASDIEENNIETPKIIEENNIEENNIENPKIIDDAPDVESNGSDDLLPFDFEETKIKTEESTEVNTGYIKHDMNAVNEMIIKKRKTKNVEKNE